MSLLWIIVAVLIIILLTHCFVKKINYLEIKIKYLKKQLKEAKDISEEFKEQLSKIKLEAKRLEESILENQIKNTIEEAVENDFPENNKNDSKVEIVENAETGLQMEIKVDSEKDKINDSPVENISTEEDTNDELKLGIANLGISFVLKGQVEITNEEVDSMKEKFEGLISYMQNDSFWSKFTVNDAIFLNKLMETVDIYVNGELTENFIDDIKNLINDNKEEPSIENQEVVEKDEQTEQ